MPTRHDPGAPPLESRLQKDLIRDNSRSIESVTGGSTDKAGVTVATIVAHEDKDTDEFELYSNLSTENWSWRKIAKSFAIKTKDQKLPKMGLQELKDAATDFRHGYQMTKPTALYSWTLVQSLFGLAEDFQPSVGQMNAELRRMFPDIKCDLKRRTSSRDPCGYPS